MNDFSKWNPVGSNDGMAKIAAHNIDASRESDVSSQLALQDKLSGELMEYAQRLEQTLLPILRDPGPEGAEKNPTPAQPLVPLAMKIRSHNERLTDVIVRLNSIFQRLEL